MEKCLPTRGSAAVLFTLAVATSACASNAPAPDLPAPDDLYTVLLNGRVIQVGEGSVLDLLKNRYALSLARGYGAMLPDEPLVVLDRVQLEGGIRLLAAVPAFHAASIAVLRPIEATARFGPRGRRGAIVVMTKRGRPACPPDIC